MWQEHSQVTASPPQRRSSGLSALQEGWGGVSKTAGGAHARRPPEPLPTASPVNSLLLLGCTRGCRVFGTQERRPPCTRA